MLIYSRAPYTSYFYMSGDGEPPAPGVNVQVTPPENPPEPAPPAGPTHADHAKVVAELEGIKSRLDTVAEDAKEWSKAEIQAALSRLENLEATATEGLTNLAAQVTEIKTRLADLLTRKSQEPPEGALPVNPESPPDQPPPGETPPAEGGDGQKGAVTNPAPAPQKPSKKVV